MILSNMPEPCIEKLAQLEIQFRCRSMYLVRMLGNLLSRAKGCFEIIRSLSSLNN